MRRRRSSSKNEFESGPPRLEQVERTVEVGVDERIHLGAIELFEPGAEPLERVGVLRSGELADLVGHRFPSVADVEGRSVGVHRSVHRIDGMDRDEVLHLGPGRVERVLEEVRHRQHGRAVVEPEALLGDHACPATGDGFTLDDRDVVPGTGEVRRGRQPAESGSDDDDSHR
jgi:hypothetical protein